MNRLVPFEPLHPSIQASCPRCRGTGYLTRRNGEIAVAEKCSCVGFCILCRDTGWTDPPVNIRQRRTRCSCQRLNERVELFNRATIPGKHFASTRSPESFRPSRDAMEAMKQASKFLQNFEPKKENTGIIFWGDVGRGKTHLMVAILRELIFQYGISARFIEFSHLLADLKSAFDRSEGASSVMEPLVHVDVLAIDELGKGRNTDFEIMIVDELVSRRYNSSKMILATTNFSPNSNTGRSSGDLFTETAPGLIDRIGPRVFSRLREMCQFSHLGGRDHRLEISAKRDIS